MMISWTGFHQLIRPRPSVPRLVHDFIRNLGVPKIAKHCSMPKSSKLLCQNVRVAKTSKLICQEFGVEHFQQKSLSIRLHIGLHRASWESCWLARKRVDIDRLICLGICVSILYVKLCYIDIFCYFCLRVHEMRLLESLKSRWITRTFLASWFPRSISNYRSCCFD